MSRPRYYWYGFIVQTIKQYQQLGDTIKEKEAKLAIDTAIRQTLEKDNGIARVGVVEMIYIKHTHTLEGAALALYISTSTGKRYARDFVYDVAKKLGYL